MNRIFNILICFLCCFISCTSSTKKEALRIACASNMQYAIREIWNAYPNKEKYQLDLVTASSGKLCHQIMHGAPYDIFLSADRKYPEKLYKEAYAFAPKTYAYGQLALWSFHQDPELTLNSLCTTASICLPNPKTAPYGLAAQEVLAHYQCETTNVIVAENISQSSHFIKEKAVKLGFSAYAIILAQADSLRGNYLLLPPESYSAIEQSAVLIKNSTHPLSQDFYNFLFHSSSQEILQENGYRITLN